MSLNPLSRPRSWLALLCGLMAAGCGQTDFPSSGSPSASHQEASLIGDDGELTVTTENTVLNRYAAVTADVTAGATSLELASAADLDSPLFGPLAAGDLVLIVQMQGAEIDTSDTASYGTVTDLRGAGRYEFAYVGSVAGNTLRLACAGLRNSYSAAGHTQVVRVPQLTRLTVADAASVVALPWNGQRGGMVVLHVQDTTTLVGDISANGQGFRGGALDPDSSDSASLVSIFTSNNSMFGGEKGESIVGNAATYATLGGRYGRGAPANGGGGGNGHNAGGGGGANGFNGNPWSGQGVMSGSVTGAAAWALDPAYIANGNARTDSSGGGRGGYTYSSTNQNALTLAPSDATWGGNNRQPVGGYGGRPLTQDPSQRLFLGGGGGAGDGNNNASAPGANGGGLVFLISNTVGGTGRIRANGAVAGSTINTHNDAPGGGGGGGTVLVVSGNLSGIRLEANGGKGGDQLITTAEAEGPGGGGGGGFIAVSGGSVTTSVLGGVSGTTSSSSLTEFPVNGATFGATGETGTLALDALPLSTTCAPVDLVATLTNGTASPVPGTTVPYTFTVSNSGPLTASDAPVSLPVPTGVTGLEWTCTASGGATCPAASGTGALSTNVTLPPGGSITYALNAAVSPSATSPLVVTGSIGVPADVSDYAPENNSATDSDTLAPQADLSVTLTKPAEPATEGVPFTYSVEVVNAGPSTASNVVVTFPVPAGSTFVSGTGTGWSCSEAAGAVTCTLPSLPPGTAPALALQVVPTAGGSSIDATVSVGSDATDPAPGNNADSETVTVESDSDNDGIGDAREIAIGTDPNDPDTDDDGLLDGTEVNTGGTNPLDDDSDDDGLLDGTEDADHDGVVDPNETDPRDADTDDDGLQDGTEQGLTTPQGSDTHRDVFVPDSDPSTKTNPLDSDSDDDGLLDGQEDADHDGQVDSNESDPLNPDTDGGGVNDGVEVGRGTSPLNAWDDNELQVVGSGCSTTGSNGLPALGFWTALVLLVFSRRPGASARMAPRAAFRALASLGAVAVLALASPALAQTPSLSTAIDAQQFKPAPGKEDVLGLHGAGVPGHLRWRAGLFLNYADDPLVIINPANDALLTRLVDNQLGFDLIGAVGLGERFEVGLTLPIALQQSVTAITPTGNRDTAWGGGLGDLRLVPKVMLLESAGLRLGLAVPLILPTAGAREFRGQAGLGVQPRLAADYTLSGGTRLLANVGANIRERQELLNLSVGPELTYGLGAAIPFELKSHRFTGLASLAGAVGLGASTGTQREELPLELQGALQYRFTPKLLATLGVGRGIIRGYGMPAFRILGGLSWTEEDPPRREPTPVVLDIDGDGGSDGKDQCPDQPEDKDGFQDEDGCADPDNDQDGVVDTADKCPLQPEDKDGFQDEDGCADPDNDEDGVEDTADKCPPRPEDKDGFQDEDGCPEPDNDRDGIPDGQDKCPNEAEVINGTNDEDGCPDEGKGKVQVTAGKLLILEKVYFATNKDLVLARSFPLLQQVAAVLRANPQLAKVRIEGHTDSQGDDAFNLDLSQRRANSVRRFLVEQGIAAERLEAVGYGETKPVDTNKTAQGRENNRRVEFTIVETAEEAQ
jgi:uncharacterized repeat protein (TIGR01451 family)